MNIVRRDGSTGTSRASEPQAGAGNRDSLCSGFSLLELVIVLATIAILLVIAVPSYRQYLQRGHRAEAIRMMLAVADCQERLRVQTGFYDTSRCGSSFESDFYGLRIAPPDESPTFEYEIIAEPRLSDRCGSLSLDQAGTRGIGGEPELLAACWGGR